MNNSWSNKGPLFVHLRRAIVLNLLKSDGRRRDIYFSYAQLVDPLNTFLCTNDSNLNLAKLEEQLFNATFEKPRRTDACYSCLTVFDGIEEYEDYNDYYIHINKKDGKIACSESADSSSFRSVDEGEAKKLLLGLSLNTDLYEKVQKLLRDRKRQRENKERKRPKSQNSAKAGETTNDNRESTPLSGIRPTISSAGTPTSSQPQQKKQNTRPTPNKGGHATVPSQLPSAVSNEEFEYSPLQQQSSTRTTESIKEFLYDNETGKLRADVLSVLSKDYFIAERKGTRQEKVDAAIKFIAPRSTTTEVWNNEGSAPKSNTTSADAGNLHTVLAAISNMNSSRAANAIIRLLESSKCRAIKERVEAVITKTTKDLSILVTTGIKKTIQNFTNEQGGTRPIPIETLVKNTVLSSVWGFVEQKMAIPYAQLIEALGTTKTQIKSAVETARGIIDNGAKFVALERATRSDFIRDALFPHLLDWVQDDRVSRFDSNQSTEEIEDPRNPGKMLRIHQRIWRLTNKEQQWQEFLSSEQYQSFVDETGAEGVGYTVFRDGIKKLRKLVCDPKPESCVDEKVSGMEYAMEALYDLSRNNPHVRRIFDLYEENAGGISSEDFREILRLRGSHKLVERMCCPMVEEPDLHIDKDKPCPKVIPLKCTHGLNGKRDKDGVPEKRCRCCGFGNRLGNLFDVLKENEAVQQKPVTVMVWEDARRQGTQSNGKDNTQRELTSKVMTVVELLEHFQKMLDICIPHIQEIRWIKHLQDTDFSKLSRDTIIIFTDFAALMALRARQAKNSSVDAHAIIANFVILWNKRDVEAKGKRKDKDGKEVEITEEVTISNVDVVHFFAETFEKGKKNDHQMHRVCLDEIIRRYRAKLREMKVELKHVIIWTDNAPHQYRCRQTFIQVASIELRHPGITVTHRLAVVDNFKGIHDAVGKDPSHKVRELENQGIRSPTAFWVFVNCIQHLETLETKWAKMERDKDIGIKLKGRFGIDERVMYFVVEHKKDFDRLAAQYPGRILLCDRSVIQDTVHGAAISQTTQLHEVGSLEKDIPSSYEGTIARAVKANNKKKKAADAVKGEIRSWRVKISRLPCNCKKCNGQPAVVWDGMNVDLVQTGCKFSIWRGTQIYSMKTPVHLEPKEAITLSEEDYLAMIEAEDRHEDEVEASTEPTSGGANEVEGDASSRYHSDASSIQPLVMLCLEHRARAMRLLQSESDPRLDLTFTERSAYAVHHTSLKRLGPRCWLNDEVIDAYNMQVLAPKLNEKSYIYSCHFMGKLLQTGPDGTYEPNYKYSEVNGWSSKISGGLFSLNNLYIPINHENIHWLTLQIDLAVKKISLWDSQGEKMANAQYTNTALRYLGDEYKNAFPNENVLEWMKTWRIEDLSEECPQQANGFDCGIFTLLNLSLLVEEGIITRDSYSQESIDAKEVRKVIAHMLWEASSNRPEV